MDSIDNKQDVCFGPFHLSRVRRTLWRGAERVPLTPTEFDVLLVLIAKNEAGASTEELIEKVWRQRSVDVNTVYQTVGRLRKKLGADEIGEEYISRGNAGYLLAAAITYIPSESGANGHKGHSVLEDPGEGDAAVHEPPASELLPDTGKKVWHLRHLLMVSTLLTGAFVLTFIFTRLHSQPESLPVITQLTRDGRAKAEPLIFDGGSIWFTEFVQGKWEVVNVRATGGEPEIHRLPFASPSILGTSLDGSSLRLSSGGGRAEKVWLWPFGGDNLQLLPASTSSPTVDSPDGETSASVDGSILVFSRKGKVVNRIVTPPGSHIMNLRWSPNGSRISFALAPLQIDLATLMVTKPSSGSAQPIAQKAIVGEDQQLGTWTRDGKYYIFAAGARDMHDLWATSNPEESQDPDRRSPRRLTNGPMNWVSPTTGSTTGEVYAIGELRRGELASLKGGRQDWQPYWDGVSAYEMDFSRDGKRVAYVHYPDHRLCIAAADGSHRVRLAGVNFEAHQPHWSPDGNRIAFMGRLDGKWRVVVADAETNRWEQLVPNGPDQGVPTWTGEGRLVYGDFPDGDAHRIMKLHVFDSRTHKVSVLARSEGLWTVRCSPDGKYLAALRQDSTGLLISRWGSSDWRQILASTNLDDLNWSADSQRLLVLRSRHLLTTLDFSGDHVRHIADVATFPYASEQWFGLAPDGSVLGLRGVTSQEVYSVRWQP